MVKVDPNQTVDKAFQFIESQDKQGKILSSKVKIEKGMTFADKHSKLAKIIEIFGLHLARTDATSVANGLRDFAKKNSGKLDQEHLGRIVQILDSFSSEEKKAMFESIRKQILEIKPGKADTAWVGEDKTKELKGGEKDKGKALKEAGTARPKSLPLPSKAPAKENVQRPKSMEIPKKGTQGLPPPPKGYPAAPPPPPPPRAAPTDRSQIREEHKGKPLPAVPGKSSFKPTSSPPKGEPQLKPRGPDSPLPPLPPEEETK